MSKSPSKGDIIWYIYGWPGDGTRGVVTRVDDTTFDFWSPDLKTLFDNCKTNIKGYLNTRKKITYEIHSSL